MDWERGKWEVVRCGFLIDEVVMALADLYVLLPLLRLRIGRAVEGWMPTLCVSVGVPRTALSIRRCWRMR